MSDQGLLIGLLIFTYVTYALHSFLYFQFIHMSNQGLLIGSLIFLLCNLYTPLLPLFPIHSYISPHFICSFLYSLSTPSFSFQYITYALFIHVYFNFFFSFSLYIYVLIFRAVGHAGSDSPPSLASSLTTLLGLK